MDSSAANGLEKIAFCMAYTLQLLLFPTPYVPPPWVNSDRQQGSGRVASSAAEACKVSLMVRRSLKRPSTWFLMSS